MAALEIRACGEEDLPQVADLLLAGARPDPATRTRVIEHARDAYFRHPWADPELPSLVCYDGAGHLQGFIGVTARRMRFRSEIVAAAVPGNYVVRGSIDGRANSFAAIGLMRRFLSGKQAVSITDTANDLSRRLWEAAGGFLAAGYSFDWFRPIRPTAALLQIVEAERRRALPFSRPMHAVGKVTDAFGARLLARMGAGKRVAHERAPFDADTGIGLIDGQRQYELVGAYDRAGFDWLMGQIERKAAGRTLVRHVVLQDGRPVGAFIYILRGDGYAEALLAVAREGRHEFLLSAMIEDAAERGATVLTGPVDPRRLPDYKSQRCFMFCNQWVIVHSRRPEIADAVHRGRALLTGLDGEKWTMFGDLYGL